MPHWLDGAYTILQSDSDDLRELAKIGGYSPSKFYVGQDFSQCDLAGQDLRNLDLTGAIIPIENLDDKTKIDPFFDPRILKFSIKRYLEIPKIIVNFARYYQVENGISYTGNAIKKLLELGYVEIISDDKNLWQAEINNNYTFYDKLIETQKHSRKRFELMIDYVVYEKLFTVGRRFSGRSPGIVVSLIIALKKLGIIQFSENVVYGPDLKIHLVGDHVEWRFEMKGWKTTSAPERPML